VEAFLESGTTHWQTLQRETHRLADENKKLQSDLEEHQRREAPSKRALLHSQRF